jgi:type 1 glutamine amidotransferase
LTHLISFVWSAAFVAALILCPALASADGTAAPVKCLWMGLAPHSEPVMEDALRVIKEKYPSVQVTPTENLDDLKIENLKNYDVLFLVQMKVENGNPPDFAKQGIVDFLKNGGGLVVTHFAIANVQEWRDSIDIFGAMWVNGKSTHGPYHEFRVDLADDTHPIVKGVRPFMTNDELYLNLLMRPDMRIIMTANEERAGHTVAEPMLATHYFYNARCVYFALGHDVKSTQAGEYDKILVQSIEWAACRR